MSAQVYSSAYIIVRLPHENFCLIACAQDLVQAVQLLLFCTNLSPHQMSCKDSKRRVISSREGSVEGSEVGVVDGRRARHDLSRAAVGVAQLVHEGLQQHTAAQRKQNWERARQQQGLAWPHGKGSRIANRLIKLSAVSRRNTRKCPQGTLPYYQQRKSLVSNHASCKEQGQRCFCVATGHLQIVRRKLEVVVHHVEVRRLARALHNGAVRHHVKVVRARLCQKHGPSLPNRKHNELRQVRGLQDNWDR
eukprot:1886606-Pleurochrysis_carterae.AAC.2